MFIDTTILIRILNTNKDTNDFKKIFDHLQNGQHFISALQLAEVSDWCLKNELDPNESISCIKKMANIMLPNEAIYLSGSKIKKELRDKGIRKAGINDGIILATARHLGQKLLTTDNDFRSEYDVIVLEFK